MLIGRGDYFAMSLGTIAAHRATQWRGLSKRPFCNIAAEEADDLFVQGLLVGKFMEIRKFVKGGKVTKRIGWKIKERSCPDRQTENRYRLRGFFHQFLILFLLSRITHRFRNLLFGDVVSSLPPPPPSVVAGLLAPPKIRPENIKWPLIICNHVCDFFSLRGDSVQR